MNKISVFTPSHNPKWLDECYESLKNQTYKNWELIIVDDFSTDDSLKVINRYKAKYPDKIRVIEKNAKDKV